MFTMKRPEKIKALSEHLNLDGPGLELGPHVEPMFSRRAGYNVKYLETRDTETLREVMVKEGRDPDIVQEIDFVLQRRVPLVENTGGETFDWVASSHVVEHIPDFIGHLGEVRDALNPGGAYAMIVPDRNYCFDCLKPATSLGDVIEGHVTKDRRGAIAGVVDEFRYGVLPKGVRIGGWTRRQSRRKLVHKYPDWKERLQRVLDNDFAIVNHWYGHQWYFDPINFGEIYLDLVEFGFVDLQLEALIPTHFMDFLVVLRKSATLDPEAAQRVIDTAARRYKVPRYSREIADA